MHGTWVERARWSWVGPHDFQHDVWIEALVDDQTHEIQSWCAATRLGGYGQLPRRQHFRVEEYGPQTARDMTYETALAYREKFGGPAT